ncbi:MAG: hypothetical protein ACREIQ_09965 [Nitrospiria bacterium]
MSYPLSACVFIKDNQKGAFCLWESLASWLPFVDQFIIMDLVSIDGTWETLCEIAGANPKIELRRRPWPRIDAGVFADLANDLIQMCRHEHVIYFQADEVPHQNLLRLAEQRFREGQFDLSFWRIQFRDNFQKIKWFPHLVHRVGHKEKFNFVGDGMTSDRTWDAKICSSFGGEYFPRWGGMQPAEIPVSEMITDVSLVGGFRDNIIERRALHAPFWHEEPTIEGKPAAEWAAAAMANPDWTRPESPFDLPQILRWHVGGTRYEVRPEIIEAIKWNDTRGLIGL